MKRFIEGDDRTQSTLFPASLDEYVDEDNLVQVIDAFVDTLDLEDLGFKGVVLEATGRPSYQPSVLLKIYVYGYLNRIASSRRLERETQRNIEMMWLTGRLMPDFKTIANFRKVNAEALRGVCRELVVLCRNLDLFADGLVAIDSSKFKAVNNQDRNFTVAKMKRRLEQIEKSIDRYMAMMDTADRQEPEIAEARKARLGDKIKTLKEQMEKLKQFEAQMLEAKDKQLSLTDPDARSMMTSGRGTGMVGYNVQATVDAEHHLIIDHEVTQTGLDNGQLAEMATRAKEATGVDDLTVVADRGYFEGEQIRACDEANITTFVPKPQTSGSKAKGRFGKQDFIDLPDRKCLSLFCWREADLALQRGRKWQDTAYLLDDSLRCLSVENAMYDRQRAPHQTLGARGGVGSDPAASRFRSRENGGASMYGGASLWHAQIMDGCDPFPYSDERAGRCRDEPLCARLQHQADDQDPGDRTALGGDQGLWRGFSRFFAGVYGYGFSRAISAILRRLSHCSTQIHSSGPVANNAVQILDN